MSEWQIELYTTTSGSSPVADFFDELSDREMVKVDAKLQLLKHFGTSLDRPHVAPVRGKIWELRITGQRQQRVLYATVEGKTIVLLHALTKKSRRIPSKDISLAESRYRDYVERLRSR